MYPLTDCFYLTVTTKPGMKRKAAAKQPRKFSKAKGYSMLQTAVQNPGRASGSPFPVELSPHDVIVALIHEHER